MPFISARIGVLADLLLKRDFFIGTAESCTGGLIGHLMTNEAGSSGWYAGGVVTYSNAMKKNILGVSEGLLVNHGAVSSECVLGMVKGLTALTHTEAGIAVSGIAGPGGGTPDKPVGTVFIAWRVLNKSWWEKFCFQGNRLEIKSQTAAQAVEGLIKYLSES
ncbi:MAG: CinA family protein [Desulfonatronovibrio sp.]